MSTLELSLLGLFQNLAFLLLFSTVFTIFMTCPPPQRLLLVRRNLFFFFKWGEEGKEEEERGAGDSNEGSNKRERERKETPYIHVVYTIYTCVSVENKPPKELQMSVVQPPGCLPEKFPFSFFSFFFRGGMNSRSLSLCFFFFLSPPYNK